MPTLTRTFLMPFGKYSRHPKARWQEFGWCRNCVCAHLCDFEESRGRRQSPAIAKLLEWMQPTATCCSVLDKKGVNYKLDKDGNVTTEGVDPKLAYTVKEMQPLTQLRNMCMSTSPLNSRCAYPSFKTASGRVQDPLAYRNGFDAQPYTESRVPPSSIRPSNAADFVRFYNENIQSLCSVSSR